MSALETSHVDPPDPGPVDLRRLRYFVAVCDHGGFTRAAAALGMAQPALSRHIQLLEKELGLPLFNRTGRAAEPSPQGRLLLAAAREQLRLLDHAVRDLRERFAAPAIQVRLGVCPTIAPLFAEAVAAGVRQRQPTLALSLVKAYSGDIQSLLRQNQLDLALTYGTSAQDGIEATDLLAERLVLVGSAAAPEAMRHRWTLADIAGLRLILPSRVHELRRIIDRASAAKGLDLRPELELDSLDAVRSVLAEPASRYVTILPLNSASLGMDPGSLSVGAIEDPGMQRTIALVRPRRADPDAAAALVGQIAMQRAEALRSQRPGVFLPLDDPGRTR